jgi:hypothetical protein
MIRSPSEELLRDEHSGDPRSPCVSYLQVLCTSGEWWTEEDACKAFDEAVIRSGAFTIWREVSGECIQPLAGINIKNRYRIDRVLFPTEKLREAGWTKGLIGVEIKRSSINAGPPVSQMMDYLRCIWNSPKKIKVQLDYVFLFPLQKTMGTIASLMAQNRVGTCFLDNHEQSEWHRLAFFLGEQKVVVCYLNKGVIEVGNLNVGSKTGSR